MNISFRNLKVSDGKDNLSGIALCFESYEDALYYCKLVESGFRSKVGNVMSMKFRKPEHSKEYSMAITINGLEEFLDIDIPGVEAKFVKEFEEQLQMYGYIFVVAAESNKESEFEIIKENYFCVSNINVNSRVVKGVNPERYPLHILKELVATY